MWNDMWNVWRIVMTLSFILQGGIDYKKKTKKEFFLIPWHSANLSFKRKNISLIYKMTEQELNLSLIKVWTQKC